MMIQKLIRPGLFLMLAVSAQASLGNNPYADAYLENLKNGSLSLQIKTCEKIHDFSGIRNPAIFDQLKLNLLELAAKEKPNREEQKALIACMPALASSGINTYESVFKQIAETTKKRKLRKNAELALVELDKFQRWNPVIYSNDYEQAGRSKNNALWMRMVASSEWDIAQYAIEQAKTFNEYNLDFIILVEEQLQAAVPASEIEEARLEFLSLSLEYLMAHPEFGKYTSLVNDIAENSKNKKFKKAARKALNI